MPVYAVVSEIMHKTIPVLDYGQGPSEPYAIVAIVVAKSREQARWLAWQTDNDFDGDVRDMPNFRTRKLADHPDGAKGIVSDWDNYEHYWNDPKTIDLLNSSREF